MTLVRSSRRKPQRFRPTIGRRRPVPHCNLAELKREAFSDPLADLLRGEVQERVPYKVVVPFVRAH